MRLVRRKRVIRARRVGIYRSVFESKVAKDLQNRNIPFKYETLTLDYIRPQSNHKYTPDFILENGIIIETKGEFDSADRKKHRLVRAQYPELDIRFVFSNSRELICTATYGEWCDRYGFKYHDKVIPVQWVEEKKKA